jgi:hypothetical protein
MSSARFLANQRSLPHPFGTRKGCIAADYGGRSTFAAGVGWRRVARSRLPWHS